MKTKIQVIAYILIAFVFFNSCDSFKDDEYDDYKEVPKNIDGVWRIKTVSRNGIDITKMMDFSEFRLNLNQDGSYSIDNYLPFAVKEDGQWRVDDPEYPFNLIMREKNSGEDVSIRLKYPILEGRRIMSVSVSPGCYSNTYQYVFEKVETN